MGSYAECWLGPFYVGSTKNDIDPGLMALFRSGDKTIVCGKNRELPFQRRRWSEGVEDEEDVSVVFYRAPVSIVRDRLELKGYTLDVAKSAFTTSIRAEAAQYTAWAQDSGFEVFGPIARVLQVTDVDQWLAALQVIRDKDLTRHDMGGDKEQHDDPLIGYMLERDWYGYPGPDLNVALRLALEVCSDQEELTYDVTDLILSEYFSKDEDFVSYALDLSSFDYSSSGKTIILTEGRSDTWIISESLNLLYPHLSDYFTFMDFEGARVGGSVGSLANIVKAFMGAGIVNKVIAIFDNDTAAEVAIRTLRNLRLPANMRVLRLPDLAVLQEYPTIGPSGSFVMNVNGVAASIELYFGVDVLRDEAGTLAPVQWTGYDASVGKYQGEVLFKDQVQERFKRRLDACRRDRQLLNQTDWTGLRAILSDIFAAFHDLDGKQICSSVGAYHNH
jgi:hypothetical protein